MKTESLSDTILKMKPFWKVSCIAKQIWLGKLEVSVFEVPVTGSLQILENLRKQPISLKSVIFNKRNSKWIEKKNLLYIQSNKLYHLTHLYCTRKT